MTPEIEHPALERLARLEARWFGEPSVAQSTRNTRDERPRMGYQPSLDGVRALSVIAVIFYHAGFSWMHGGFFGVEVFFVVSGFLITSLLIEERDRSGVGRIELRQFWLRRFRRLLPALATLLLVVAVWAVFHGTVEQRSQLRHDYPWGIFYVANWGQIFSQVSYFAGTPTLLRHLWSLAVEEQWYALWPLAFIAMSRSRSGAAGDRSRGRALAVVAIGLMVATAVARSTGWPTRWFNPFRLAMQSVDPTNFLYLSTFTRSSGLLLGAALAFLYRPWQVVGRPRGRATQVLNIAAVASTVVLVGAFVVGRIERDATYLWLLPLVTLASTALVAVVVHPWAEGARALFGSRPMVEIGKRSYGLYLWSWPISRIADAYEGSWPRFAIAMAITVPVSELCYRFIETPIRKGALGQWWADRSRRDWHFITGAVGLSSVVLVVTLTGFYASAPKVFDAGRDTSGDVVFDPDALAGGDTDPAVDPAATSSTSSLPATPTTLPTLPRRMVIVGDSTAHSLAINLPAGIESTFTIADGSVEGCSVYDGGTAVSSIGYKRSFGECDGWEQEWVDAATKLDAELALVSIGAWDVFDVSIGAVSMPFNTPSGDQRFITGVQQGIDALAAAGVKVALLEVPCMRPVDPKGAGVPALPERGDDARVAHLNDLLRQIAASNPATTTFITGPSDYCTDEAIATDLGYRWDGVHAYKPGAKLTFETVASTLLAIPIP